MNREKLRQAIITWSYRENHVEPFTLASGKKSPYYFDLKQTLLRPEYLRIAAELLLNKMKETLPRLPDAVSGLTMGADPLIYSLTLLAEEKGENILPVVIRKKPKDHGSGKRAEGILTEIKEDSVVVLLDDVVTTGGSTLQARDALVELGIHPKYAFALLDRKEGGRENMEKEGIDLHTVFSLEDFRSNL